MGNFVRHEPCPSCGSSDALSRYDNGTAHCFQCKYNDNGDGTTTDNEETQTERDWSMVVPNIIALPKRGLTKETCEAWGYGVGDNCQVATFKDERGKVIAQKLRLPGKQFKILGAGKDLPLWGVWKFSGGKHLVITEGEIDCLSVSQAMDNKWPVVSLPNGASSAAKAIALCYDWLDRFQRIVLMFDMDKAGRDAVEEVAPMLPPGKAAVAVLPRKDANEVLLHEGPATILKCFWDAPFWKPDGIVAGEEFTLEKVKQAAVVGFEYPYPKLQEKVLGIRKGELTLWTAGSGIGKSTIVRELGYYLHESCSCYVGNVFLEENNTKTAQAYVAIDNSVPLGRLRFDTSLLSDDQWRASLDRVVRRGMWFYNHFGSLESKNLITKLRYLATVCKVDFILLDHVSIVTSGLESSKEGERKDIDILMTRLRSLIEETGVGVIAIVHLKRAEGKNFNEGGQVSLNDLRGSASLEQLSDNVFALERNQQGANPTRMTVRVLKCREMGDLGEADLLNYNRQTGRIELDASTPFDEVTEG